MQLTIYHNPRCSKSRQTLELIRERGIEPAIVPYLDEPPTPEKILELAGLLDMSVADLLRRNEDDFRSASDLPPLNDDKALARWVSAHPRVLQRPIVVDETSGRAVVGRPPENVLELLAP